MPIFTESIIEHAAIDWLKDLGYAYPFGPEIAFDGAVRTLASLRDALLSMLVRDEVRMGNGF